MKYEINSKVINGNLTVNRKRIKDVLNSFEGKEITLTIQKKKKRRSNNQNAYYWGVVIPLMVEAVKKEWGDTRSTNRKNVYHDVRRNLIVVIRIARQRQLERSTFPRLEFTGTLI